MQLLLALLLFFGLSSCGESDLLKKFKEATTKQNAISELSLELWARSPSIDGANSSLTASDDLESKVPRTKLYFENISDLEAPISSSKLKMQYSSLKADAPSFFDWAGKTVPWTNDDFRVLMAYYHLDKGISYIKTNFPSADTAAISNSIYPLKIRAAESGDALSTGYDYVNKIISFYKQKDGTRAGFSTAEESDAIYHELAHALQHSLNSTVLTFAPFHRVTNTDDPVAQNLSGNPDLDAIIEGLADFFAASVLRQEDILPYLQANASGLISSSNRNGNSHIRKLSNAIYYPKAYMFQPHLDGRVLASALNDYRKYLQGKTVTILSAFCSTSCTRSKTSGTVSEAAAWDAVNVLANTAFSLISTSTTFHGYSLQLESSCGGGADCTVLTEILKGRGLYSSRTFNFEGTDLTFNTDPATADVLIDATLGWMPFPNDTGFANDDASVDPCEVIIIFPKIKNNTDVVVARDMDLYNTVVTINSASGITDLKFPGTSTTVESTANSSGRFTKIFGWMTPGSSSETLVQSTSSDWYTSQAGAKFSQRISSTYFPADIGWLARASATGGATISINFTVTSSAFRASTLRRTSATFSQTKTVASTATTLCSGN